MALNTPSSANEVNQRMKTDVQRELPDSNPFLKNSWLGAIITSIANRIYDFYIQLTESVRQSIPDTATNDQLERWAAIYGINRLAATGASGNIVATGTATTNIPISTTFASSDGLLYDSTAAVVIAAQVLAVTSITRSGSTATVTTTADHGLSSNVPVTIAGAVETEYNVSSAEIQVTGLDTFTYTVSGTPSTPATGTITAAATFISVPVQAQGANVGANTNQPLDAILTLQAPISGVDNDAYTDFGELGGGTDQETDTDLRDRMLSRIQNPVANFNVAAIDAQAKLIAGVTRVFVEEATPVLGQVTIYFMRDNDTPSAIPSASEVTETKNKILEIKPANMTDSDVIVSAPTAVSTNFTFTALSPNTATMQAAVTASLEQFFSENTEVGVDVDEDLYRAAISNTIDTSTGDKVASFTLSAPSGDITITTGEIGTLGTVSYP